jgi:hypothetical protein
MSRKSLRLTLSFALALALVLVALQAVNPITASGLAIAMAAPGVDPAAAIQPGVSEAYGELPLHFEANQGQTDAQVNFLARGSGYTLFLTPGEAVLKLSMPVGFEVSSFGLQAEPASFLDSPSETGNGAVLRLQFVGANPASQVVGLEELPGKINYFIGNDSSQWQTNIPTYAKVKYQAVYPGVDVVYYGYQGQLEYDLIVAPGANPDVIRLNFQGAERLEVAAEGDLILYTAGGEVRQQPPLIYQEINGTKQTISGQYVLTGKSQVGFDVAAYDPSRPLIIDPVLAYSSYLGGGDADIGNGIAVDTAGNAYLVGQTTSSDFPTAGPIQNASASHGDLDVFVMKLNSAGSELVYATYLGGNGYSLGSGEEIGRGIAVDASGNAYITGQTNSLDFPLANPLQGSYTGGFSDAFVAALNPAGSALLYATYLGGLSQDFGNSIALDTAGNAYVTGQTSSNNFPTGSASYQAEIAGGSDAFLTQIISASGVYTWGYSTYLGGSSDDVGRGIAVDGQNNAYVVGQTASTDFPVKNAPQSAYSGGFSDGFVAGLDPATSGAASLVYATYLGGSSTDNGKGIAVAASGNAYVTGETISVNFPTAKPFQAVYAGGTDAFVTQIIRVGGIYTWGYSTYLGGNDCDRGNGIAVDASGNVYMVGYARSADYPKLNPIQAALASPEDVMVTVLNATGSELIYSTYLGGGGDDIGRGIAVDGSGNAYVVGQTASTDFPTAGPFQGDQPGLDVFVAKITN